MEEPRLVRPRRLAAWEACPCVPFSSRALCTPFHPRTSWASAGTWGAILAGLLLLVAFGRYEIRVEHPLLPMRLFRSRALTIGTVVTALNFFVMLGAISFIMLYLQNVRGLTPVQAGVRALPLSLASLVASPLGAVLTERFGARFCMPLGMLLQAAACFTLLTWAAPDSYL